MRDLLKGRGAKAALIGVAGIGAFAVFSVLARPSNDVVWSDETVATPAQPEPAATSAADAAAPVADGALVAHGVIESEQKAVLASRITALITSLPLEPGESFSQGQMLIGFDCAQMKAEFAAASAATDAYRKTYDTNVELDRYKAIGANEVAVSRANLGKASAEARAISAGLDQCAIHAPFSGTVVERPAHAHDVAAPGQPLMTIQGSGDLKVELIIPSKWLRWIKPGTPFTFAVDETGGRIEGRIARLGAAVDPVSKTMRVTGAITIKGTVLSGMSGTAEFRKDRV